MFADVCRYCTIELNWAATGVSQPSVVAREFFFHFGLSVASRDFMRFPLLEVLISRPDKQGKVSELLVESICFCY